MKLRRVKKKDRIPLGHAVLIHLGYIKLSDLTQKDQDAVIEYNQRRERAKERERKRRKKNGY